MYKQKNRHCSVPGCNSSRSVTADKIFFTLPTNQMRDVWLQALGMTEASLKKVTYICEDHFDAENDIENYKMAKIMGQKNMKFLVRPGAVPSVDLKENIERKLTPKVYDKQTQCHPVLVRSKATQCNIQTQVSLIREEVSEVLSESSSGSPVAKRGKFLMEDFKATTSETSLGSSTSSLEMKRIRLEEIKEKCSTTTFYKIEKDPKYYLGITPEAYELVKILSKSLEIRVRDIYIVMKKISLDVEYKSLADDFGLSVSQTGEIFKNALYKLNSGLKNFIFWPTSTQIEKKLPVPFRLRYGKVVSIIDCFEIIIEKPENALHQSLTWSEYKRNNTIKYLISCTPDGLINFISSGFGGRASDMTIVLNSNYLDNLPKNKIVMADRGFKGIEIHLREKGCSLVRPPSVIGDSTLSAEEVLQTKRIASLRIHVERVINRVRNFKMLSLHSCVNRNLIEHLDEMVYLACCIINTQECIIRNVL